MTKKDVVFLFGSGADTDYNDQLPSGAAFNKVLLKNEYSYQCKKLLGNDYRKTQLVRYNSTKVFLQTIDLYHKKASQVFGEECVSKCREHYNGTKEHSDFVKNKCYEWYNSLKRANDKFSFDESAKFFLENAVFFDALDERFNSLRLPELTSRAKSVIYTYTQIFALILSKSYILDSAFQWNYEKVFDLLNNGKIIPSTKVENYYSITAKSGLSKHIVTTNYTPFAEEIIKEEVAYLHGRLQWFEDRTKLTVYNCTKKHEYDEAMANVDRIFPFISIPSGVKPIICQKQLLEYGKFISKLEKSNYLVIVGYRFNLEDNHINSIIANWLRNTKHKLIYLNFNTNVDFNNILWVEGISRRDCKHNETIDLSKSITNVHIDGETAIDTYKRYIEYLEKC